MRSVVTNAWLLGSYMQTILPWRNECQESQGTIPRILGEKSYLGEEVGVRNSKWKIFLIYQ
jgi:hypothetical protein